MINPFDYLYYKIYKAWSFLSPSGEPMGHQAAISFMLLLNFIFIYVGLVGEFPPKEVAIIVAILLIIIIFICYRPKREAKIVAKFEKESEKSRIIGNWVVTLYAILSIVALLKV